MKKINNRMNGSLGLQKNADTQIAVSLTRLVQECHRSYADYRKMTNDSVGGCLWFFRCDGRLLLAVPVGDHASDRSPFFLRKAAKMVGWLSAQVQPVAEDAKAYGVKVPRGFLVFTGDIGPEGCQAITLLIAELADLDPGRSVLQEAYFRSPTYRNLREQFLTLEPGSREFLSSI